MATYTEKKEKAEIKKALVLLMTEHDTNLKRFCEDHGYTYHTIYERLTRNSISHDLVNEMISKLDKKRSLKRIGNKLVIT
jgi:hypothetical protein